METTEYATGWKDARSNRTQHWPLTRAFFHTNEPDGIACVKKWPAFDRDGDVPEGIHRATLRETLDHVRQANLQRRLVARRLERIHGEVFATGRLARFVEFGSFATAKENPTRC